MASCKECGGVSVFIVRNRSRKKRLLLAHHHKLDINYYRSDTGAIFAKRFPKLLNGFSFIGEAAPQEEPKPKPF
jgi:hypothetical protein